MPHKNDWMISGGWWITAQVVWCIDFIWCYCPSLWFVMMTWNHLPFVVCHCHDDYISFESYRRPPIRIELWNPTMMVWGGCSFIQVPIRFHVCFYDPPPAHSQLSWSVRHHYLFPYTQLIHSGFNKKNSALAWTCLKTTLWVKHPKNKENIFTIERCVYFGSVGLPSSSELAHQKLKRWTT